MKFKIVSQGCQLHGNQKTFEVLFIESVKSAMEITELPYADVFDLPVGESIKVVCRDNSFFYLIQLEKLVG